MTGDMQAFFDTQRLNEGSDTGHHIGQLIVEIRRGGRVAVAGQIKCVDMVLFGQLVGDPVPVIA